MHPIRVLFFFLWSHHHRSSVKILKELLSPPKALSPLSLSPSLFSFYWFSYRSRTLFLRVISDDIRGDSYRFRLCAVAILHSPGPEFFPWFAHDADSAMTRSQTYIFFFLLELGKRWRWIMHGIIDSDSPTGSNVTRRFSIVERIRLFPRQISLSTTKQQQHRKDIRRVE